MSESPWGWMVRYPQVNTLEQQVERVYRGFLREPDPIAKHQFPRALRERAATLFYILLERHLEEMMPIPHPNRRPSDGAVQPFIPESARAILEAALPAHRARRPYRHDRSSRLSERCLRR